MTDLPKRCPGAHLRYPMEDPESGWFGLPVQWPTDDPDASAAEQFLRDNRLVDSPETMILLHRVLHGLHQLGTEQKGKGTA